MSGRERRLLIWLAVILAVVALIALIATARLNTQRDYERARATIDAVIESP